MITPIDASRRRGRAKVRTRAVGGSNHCSSSIATSSRASAATVRRVAGERAGQAGSRCRHQLRASDRARRCGSGRSGRTLAGRPSSRSPSPANARLASGWPGAVARTSNPSRRASPTASCHSVVLPIPGAPSSADGPPRPQAIPQGCARCEPTPVLVPTWCRGPSGALCIADTTAPSFANPCAIAAGEIHNLAFQARDHHRITPAPCRRRTSPPPPRRRWDHIASHRVRSRESRRRSMPPRAADPASCTPGSLSPGSPVAARNFFGDKGMAGAAAFLAESGTPRVTVRSGLVPR